MEIDEGILDEDVPMNTPAKLIEKEIVEEKMEISPEP
jgi:hypothetical protein